MGHGYNHPGRTDFIRAAAERLGVIDTEDNQQPVSTAAASKPIRQIDNFASQACDPTIGGDETRAKILAHCETAVQSLRVAELAAVEMTRAAYEGLGLAVPDWLPPPDGGEPSRAAIVMDRLEVGHDGPNNTPVPPAPKKGTGRKSKSTKTDPDATPTEQADDEHGTDGEPVQA